MMEARHEPILTPTDRRVELPDELDARRLARRALVVVALIGVILLVVVLAPGLGKVRTHLAGASVPWLAAGVALEALSCVSYVLLFRPVFCPRMSWRTSFEIGFSELGVGSIVPASGAGGLALGAWVLHRDGMPAEHIARRSVAFFVIKSSVNFVAVASIGAAMALGVGPHQPLALTALPAVLSVAFIALVLSLRRIDRGEPGGGKVRAARRALVDGIGEAVGIVRSRDLLVLTGALGYWAFDNAVLWATYHALGATPPLTVILMGYLIGQLGGLLPIPGGIGGIDGGLIGTLVVYGAPLASTTAAVLLYRAILFWLPLIGGAIAFASLRRGLNQPQRPDLCAA
jgi:uncharacterized membrane protein YbhN (UPF0104 family)